MVWMARAMSSFPVPLSPTISTVASVGATTSTFSSTALRAALVPTIPSKFCCVVSSFLSGLLLSQTQLLRQRRGVPYLWVDFACQRLQERYQVLLLLGGETKRPDVAGQPRVFDSAPVVERDDFLERFLAAVVHIGTTPGHVPKCWCFEGAFIGLVLCHGVPTEVRLGLIHAHANIAVILVGEVESRVTAYTTRLALEERETALGARRQCALVSRLETIVGRISRNDCPYIGSDGLGYSDGLKVVAENLAKLLLVGRNRPQVFHHLLVCSIKVIQ